MSQQPEGPPEFFSQEEMLAQIQVQQAHMRMHSEDFHNRWKEFLLTAPLESLATIQELLSAVTGGSAEGAISLGNYFEGQIVGVVVGREAFADKSEVSDIDIRSTLDDLKSHAFMPNLADSQNRYCVRCNLPAGNQVHKVPQ